LLLAAKFQEHLLGGIRWAMGKSSRDPLTGVLDDETVVVRGQEGDRTMARRIPAALRTRLEDDATFGLIELLDSERKDWSEHVIGVASDRFERRLAQESAALRTEISKALTDGLAAIRQETAVARLEMLKWSFVFWIGQVAAVAGLLAFMRR